LVALEIAEAKVDLERLRARLQAYEERYEMSSEVFYRRFRAGKLGDDLELLEWSVFWDMYQAAARRLDALVKQTDYAV
jgi:cell division septum initiation protein DivIVA